MATQTLTPVQVKFVNEAVRPTLERLIRADTALRNYVDDFDNQQTPILTNGNDLGDDAAGTAPRTDAPVLTGTLISQLRTFANARLLSTAERNAIIALLVRDLDTVTRDLTV
jgi:hypothetical protein